MRTHELARALEILAKFLRSEPNVELENLSQEIGSESSRGLHSEELKIGLSHLVALSRVDKQQWISLIKEHEFPIDIRPRDASRDILGKLLRYLEKSPSAREELMRKAPADSKETSPELMKALSSLLKDS